MVSFTSFFYGILIASITWALSLYMYSRLTQNDDLVNPTMLMYDMPNSLKESTFDQRSKKLLDNLHYNNHNNSLIWPPQKYTNRVNKDTVFGKDQYDFQFKKEYKNSDRLLQQLKPVPVKPSVTIGQGLDELGMVRNIEEQKKREEGYKNFAFNILVSDKLSLHREIPDTRHKLCKNQTYGQSLPNASIVICFYNEHFNTLLRSLHSVVERTPKNILHEIILINDFSDSKNLHEEIKKYTDENFNGKVHYYKTEKREGLIRARMFGAKKATGDVLVFLDSHIEVNKMWIEPLLSRIAISKTIVPMPIIDIINADTFQYSSSPLVRGGFNWGLHFQWDSLPEGTLKEESDFIKPIKSPTMAGGLFAMDRKYFFELGEYDAGMDVWGGENLEISFRIWMCGGTIELVPCSRVGHVFRRRRPYGGIDQQDTMLKNSLRVAHVWMDEYKNYFLKNVKKIDYGDISERQQLRQKLHCKDFAWYMKFVYPELSLPDGKPLASKNNWNKVDQKVGQPWHSRKRNYTDEFQIRLKNTALCIQSEKDVKSKGSKLLLAPCLRIKTQMWYQTDRNELVLGQMLCLEGNQKMPRLGKCHEMGGNQEWKHNGLTGTAIYNLSTGTCLGASSPTKNTQISMDLCYKDDNSSITWELVRSKLPLKNIR